MLMNLFSVIIAHFADKITRNDTLNQAIAKLNLKDLTMSLTMNDVEKIAKLSRLSLNEEEKQATLDKLNSIFELVEKMQAVDTTGVEPLTHPHEVALRLRDDAVTETDHAAEYQAVAPEVKNRLYIVPQVIGE